MGATSSGHQWGVVAQDVAGDFEHCTLCGRYRLGDRYIAKREIPRSAVVPDSGGLSFWEDN